MSRTVMNISVAQGRRVAARWSVCFVLLSLLALPVLAAADIVIDWNVVAERVAPRFGGPQPQGRALAMVQIAVHDALNAINPRFDRYTSVGLGDPGASPDAAVAAAARQTLLGLLTPLPPSAEKQAAIELIEAAYAASLGPGPHTPSQLAGIDIGNGAAAAILALRVGDGADVPNPPFTLPPGLGVYQPTPNPEFPAVVTPFGAAWAYVTPFVLNHGRQFEVEPGAIFDLAGPDYAREYNEVKQVGSARVRGLLPNSEESDIARFWPGGGSNWQQTTRDIVSTRGLDRWEHARLFALLNIGQADAFIANQMWKWTHTFWRPVTAIRWADDGNADTESDPVWRPFLVTPNYPDYPCALPTSAGAAAESLRQFFGTDAVPFSRTFNAGAVLLPDGMPPLPAKAITRSFETLSASTAEAQSARVFAGIHFREGCQAGAKQGIQVARFVAQHSLKPSKGTPAKKE
jgi:hypothetical protein